VPDSSLDQLSIEVSDSGSRMGAATGAQVRRNAVTLAKCSPVTSPDVSNKTTR
jgi:hypothetical protein